MDIITIGTTELTPEGVRRRHDQSERWLRSIRSTVGYERLLREQARAHIEEADGVKGIDYSKANVQASASADALQFAAIAHMETAEKLEAVADSAARRIRKAYDAVGMLEDAREAQALALYYLDVRSLSWDKVAEAMGYSLSRVYDFHYSGLINVWEHLPPEARDPVIQADW